MGAKVVLTATGHPHGLATTCSNLLMRRRWRVAIAAAMIVAVSLAISVGWRWWHGRAPFEPDALATTASLELTTYDVAQHLLGEEVNAPYPNPGDQLVLGRVSWRTPPQGLAGGHFTILLIDKRTDLKPGVFAVAASRQESVAIGSDGSLQAIADRYPWLSGAGYHNGGSGWYTSGDVLYVFDADASPVTLVALFPDPTEHPPAEVPVATAPVAVSDLLLAMVYVGQDDQIFWAQRLVG